MKALFPFLLFIGLIFNSSGQNIQVLNAKSGQPIEGVLLFSEMFSTQTDSSGKANIDNFDSKSNILFKHSSFLPYISSKGKIIRQGRIVLLIEDPVRLDEIVVSVNRWEQSKTEVPHTIISIQPEEVLRYSPQTTADLLGTKGGVFIQKSQMGGGSPMIRGFSANRVLIVMDGIRMNNAIYRSGNIHNVISVDAQSLDNAEIIFGPGSVIYGSDALGGVMSFNTLNPKLSTSGKFETFGKAYTRFSSANFEKMAHGSFNLGGEKWAVVFGSTFTDFNDLRMGSSGFDEYLRPEYVIDEKYIGEDRIVQNKNSKIQKYTGYNQFNLFGKLRYRPNKYIDLKFNAQHSQTGDIPRYDRLIQYSGDQLTYADWHYGPQKWTLLSTQVEYLNDHTVFDKVILLAGYQSYTESRKDRKVNKDWLRSREENLGIFSLNLDFGKKIDKNNELFYGIEGYLNLVGSKGVSENLLTGESEEIAPRYPDGSVYQSFAGYYSYKYNLKNKFILEIGSRFTYTHLKGDFDPAFYNLPYDDFDMKNSAFNGSLGIVWHPKTDWQINIHTSTGFRSPNIDDVAKVFDSEPGNVLVPNPELKPEYARNIELSILRSYANKARFEITGFYTWLKNAMVRRDFTLNGQDSIFYDGLMSKVEALQNAESATIWGANFSFEWIISNSLRTQHDLTITTGEDSEGFPLRHVPPTFGSSHLIYEKQKLYLDLYACYSDKLDFEDLAPDEQDKPHLYLPDENGNPYSPAWWTLNIKSNYKISQNLTLGGGIENILDKRYRPYSSGVVSPGINFVFSILLKI